MKNQILAVILAGVMLLTSAGSLFMCGWYVLSAKQGIATQFEIAKVNVIGNTVRSLLVDSVEYSKHNPNITPLLQSCNVLPRTPQTPGPAPSAPAAPKSSSK